MAWERTVAGKAYESGGRRGQVVLASLDGDLQPAVGDLYSSEAPPQCSAPLHPPLGKAHITCPIPRASSSGSWRPSERNSQVPSGRSCFY